ncbi:hypothetical protein AVEN_217040-1 [Araneus ventricosus]|uniref:Uncharacterized protein n=1 Tax=Araneus ventricosus TaxID=182803 RepID=A0A4Y2AEG8_ARAVE|nr:hypothetical protein AVEN_23780-1 [Araneus ventricosus]GBL78207.1 hypothetical protein AVEN_217040-1 [Araneus ventricosus]
MIGNATKTKPRSQSKHHQINGKANLLLTEQTPQTFISLTRTCPPHTAVRHSPDTSSTPSDGMTEVLFGGDEYQISPQTGRDHLSRCNCQGGDHLNGGFVKRHTTRYLYIHEEKRGEGGLGAVPHPGSHPGKRRKQRLQDSRSVTSAENAPNL